MPAQHLHPRHVRHSDVRDDQVGRALAKYLQRFLTAAARQHLEGPAEHAAHHLEHVLAVVNDQNGCLLLHDDVPQDPAHRPATRRHPLLDAFGACLI